MFRCKTTFIRPKRFQIIHPLITKYVGVHMRLWLCTQGGVVLSRRRYQVRVRAPANYCMRYRYRFNYTAATIIIIKKSRSGFPGEHFTSCEFVVFMLRAFFLLL